MKKIVALIGFPLGHSVSPAMQNAAFKLLGLDFEYLPFEVAPDDLAEALNGLRAMRFAGFNVTIPHKETIIPLLDEVTQLARVIGAVNTVVNQEGKLIGYNTDGSGFIDSLKEEANTDPEGEDVVVLGAGGASRAVSVMLAENGASSITLVDIQEEKARQLSKYITSYFGINCYFYNPESEDLQKAIDKAHILINTTPVGMHPNIDKTPLPPNIRLRAKLLVYDVVYNPAKTALLKQAKEEGCRTCSGLGMLVRQGALAFTLWTGQEAPLEVMRKAAKKALKLS
jgi:shikimate dehydrogenase